MKIRWILAVLVLALLGTQDVIAETLYCNNNARRDLIGIDSTCDPDGAIVRRCLNSTDIAVKNQCYSQLKACHQRVDRQNEQIRRENDLYYKCKAAFDHDKNRKSGNTQNKWKSRLGQAQQRNQKMSDVQRQNDQAYERAVNNEIKKTEKMYEKEAAANRRANNERIAREKREAADFQRQMKQLRQRQAREAAKIRPQRSVIGSNPNSCGPNPENSCGTPSNPCQWSNIVRWHICRGDPGWH
jgi:hypothetical protein